MKNKYILIILFLSILGCNNKKDQNAIQENPQPKPGGTMTLALPNDLDYLNPVLSADITKDAIQDLIFPSFLESI
jgi:hypothetical protein